MSIKTHDESLGVGTVRQKYHINNHRYEQPLFSRRCFLCRQFLFFIFAFVCPLPGLAQTLTPVAELTQNSDGSTYTLTYKAVIGTPTYVTSGPGIYKAFFAYYVDAPGDKYGEKITRAVVDVSMQNARPTSTAYWFYDLSSVKTIEGLENLNTSRVTWMEGMFAYCSSLTGLDVTNFDTQNVESMEGMFSGCTSLTDLDVTNFDTQNVKSMGGMFFGCNSLTDLDVTNFNTSKVTDMSFMFFKCYRLTGLDVTNFNTSNVTNMSWMFYSCIRLTGLDVTNFNTSKVTDMNRMFSFCLSLTSLDVSGFDISKVTNVTYFAVNCGRLSLLNLGHNDFSAKSGNKTAFSYVGTFSKPCRLVETFGREPLGTVTISPNNQVPPYYNYCEGYFTIADTLDTEADYTPTAKADADLWVKGRTLKAGVWNTFVVPVTLTQEQLKAAFGDDVEVGVLRGYDGKTVTFSSNLRLGIAANTPMLVKPARDINNVGFAAVDIEACDTDAPTFSVTNGNLTACFIGSYKKNITIDKDCFYYYDGKFLRSAGNSTVGCTRGYFTFFGGGTGAKQFVLDNGGETTVIDAIDGEPVGQQGPAYNLGGQCVGDDYKGIVIVGGKKVLRK